MRTPCSVTVLALCWGMCIAKSLPYIPEPELKSAENPGGESDSALTLDMCDLIEPLLLSSVVDVQNQQYYPSSGDITTSSRGKSKKYTEDMLASFYFLDRRRRQAQVGYNVNSFGLRFGKRATKLNWNSFGLRFGRKTHLSIPISALHELFCSE